VTEALAISGGIDRTPWVLFDFETVSRADLKKIGGRRYAEHASTRLVCVGMAVATPAGPRPDVLVTFRAGWETTLAGAAGLRAGEFVACAHNAIGFDRHVWARLGWPAPIRFADTAVMARRGGYPDASLDGLMQRILGRPKDSEGNALIKKLSRPSRARATFGQLPHITPEIFERVAAYCKSDVEGMRDFLPELLLWDDAGAVDNAVFDADLAIGDRGIAFDSDLAEALIVADAALAERIQATAGASAEDLRSRDTFLEMLADLGVKAANAQKKTLEKLLASDATPEAAKDLIRARQAGATIAASKLKAGLARVSDDGRLRDLVQYFGAHTGRWAGRGMQTQNLTKGKDLPEIAAVKKADAAARGVPAKDGKISGTEYDRLTEARIAALIADPIAASQDLSAAHIATLTRATLKAAPDKMLVICDFTGVENRWLAWAANDTAALELMRDPKGDPYRKFAARVYRIEPSDVTPDQRNKVGKVAELGLGYGMGAKKFRTQLLDNDVDLVALEREFRITPKRIVDEWRDLHAPIVAHWAALEMAAIEAVHGWRSRVGPYEFGRVDADVWAMLPSGRPVVYKEMAVVVWERRGNWLTARCPDGDWVSFELDPDDKRRGGEGLVYRSRKGWQSTYGGMLAENLTQAGCRELLAAAMVEIERTEGIPIVMHVHDEVVAEVAEADAPRVLDVLHKRMSAACAPAYADGMPLKAEGFYTRRYRK
jgi:DNA polymerase